MSVASTTKSAMSAELDQEMLDVVIGLEGDPETRVLILDHKTFKPGFGAYQRPE
jgi:hypothetical protein